MRRRCRPGLLHHPWRRGIRVARTVRSWRGRWDDRGRGMCVDMRGTPRSMNEQNPDELFGTEHVKRYRATDGEVGHDWRGASVLLLTTRGRRSGEERTTPLIYGSYGDVYLVVASKGGAPQPPSWYRNLEEHPEVAVQVGGERFAARARTARPEEKP